MRKASLGTIFLTVFLDLLGFGLVVPYLPGIARTYGASPFTATLLGAAYSLMQLVFIPFWGHLSDRVGRRPILIVSILGSAVGMLILGSATSLWMLFAARIWNGIATSNIAVAQAYIADITTPEKRARGMGLIGTAIGTGFVLGPVIGGVLESTHLHSRAGALPAYAAAALSALNFGLALLYLPESLPKENRGVVRSSVSPFDRSRFRAAFRFAGVQRALLVSFLVTVSFAALEQTLRMFTEDAFHMNVQGTSYLLGFMGLVLIIVQGGLIRPLSKWKGERTLVVFGTVTQSLGFALMALSPLLGLHTLYLSALFIATGSALTSPSISSLVSRYSDAADQGVALGVLQSAGAFARVCGPAFGGVLYQLSGPKAPYAASSAGMIVAALVATRLREPSPAKAAAS